MADNILFLACARNGSKGIKNKNLIDFEGQPLMHHTLNQLNCSSLKTHLVLSTDGDPIASSCEHLVDFVIDRPDELSTDTVARYPVLLHALKTSEKHFGITYDYVFDFLVTAPFRREKDIQACFDLVKQPGVSNVITAVPSHRNPYFNMVELQGDAPVVVKDAGSIVRRQDAPVTYDMNGSVYAWKRQALLTSPELMTSSTRLHVMDAMYGIDIDTPFDVEVARSCYKKFQEEKA